MCIVPVKELSMYRFLPCVSATARKQSGSGCVACVFIIVTLGFFVKSTTMCVFQAYLDELVELHKRLMTLREGHILQQVSCCCFHHCVSSVSWSCYFLIVVIYLCDITLSLSLVYFSCKCPPSPKMHFTCWQPPDTNLWWRWVFGYLNITILPSEVWTLTWLLVVMVLSMNRLFIEKIVDGCSRFLCLFYTGLLVESLSQVIF